MEVLTETAALYDQWLVSSRLRAPAAPRSEPYLRLEQRIVPMLLKSMPEAIKEV